MKLNYAVMTQLEMAKHCLKNKEVQFSDLWRIGPIVIHGIGQENIYFTSVWYGSEHYCKTNP
jgi:hypothetical protein